MIHVNATKIKQKLKLRRLPDNSKEWMRIQMQNLQINRSKTVRIQLMDRLMEKVMLDKAFFQEEDNTFEAVFHHNLNLFIIFFHPTG